MTPKAASLVQGCCGLTSDSWGEQGGCKGTIRERFSLKRWVTAGACALAELGGGEAVSPLAENTAQRGSGSQQKGDSAWQGVRAQELTGLALGSTPGTLEMAQNS